MLNVRKRDINDRYVQQQHESAERHPDERPPLVALRPPKRLDRGLLQSLLAYVAALTISLELPNPIWLLVLLALSGPGHLSIAVGHSSPPRAVADGNRFCGAGCCQAPRTNLLAKRPPFMSA